MGSILGSPHLGKLPFPFEGPHNKAFSVLGSILGSPYLGKLPFPFLENRADPKPKGPSTQYSGTWALCNTNCSTGLGQVYDF